MLVDCTVVHHDLPLCTLRDRIQIMANIFACVLNVYLALMLILLVSQRINIKSFQGNWLNLLCTCSVAILLKACSVASFDNSLWVFHTNPSNVKHNCKQIGLFLSLISCKYSSCNIRFRSFLLNNRRGRCSVCDSCLNEQSDVQFYLRQGCF